MNDFLGSPGGKNCESLQRRKCIAWSCFSVKSDVFGQRMPHFAVILWETEVTNAYGIICGRLWGSLAVEDHLRSIMGIICGLGIICGWGSFAVLYSAHHKQFGHFVVALWGRGCFEGCPWYWPRVVSHHTMGFFLPSFLGNHVVTLKTSGKLGRVKFRKDFWVFYWGPGKQIGR